MEQAMIVTVQFSGNAKTYDYHVIPQDDREAVLASAGGGQGICRVVVPGKIKDDGVLSLSIANVFSHRMVDKDAKELELMYPVVRALPAKLLDFAKLGVLAIDAAKELQAQIDAEEKAKTAS